MWDGSDGLWLADASSAKQIGRRHHSQCGDEREGRKGCARQPAHCVEAHGGDQRRRDADRGSASERAGRGVVQRADRSVVTPRTIL